MLFIIIIITCIFSIKGFKNLTFFNKYIINVLFLTLSMGENIFNYEGEIRDENPKGERIKTQANVDYLYRLGWSPKRSILDEDSHN